MAGAFDLLKQDHREVEQLFAKFEASPDREIALQICDELSIHATIEEEMVYPLLRSKVAMGMADEARDEHTQAKEIVARIYGMEPDDSGLADAVQELKQVIEHHVQEEETQVFPKMEEELPDTYALLGNELAKRKALLKEANERVHDSVADKAAPSGSPS